MDVLTLRAPLLAMRRHCVAFFAAFCGMLAWPLAAQSPNVEYAVKATYLYKFAPFVEWPAGTFAAGR